MRYRQIVPALIAAMVAVMWQVSISAHASYVMEADGLSLSAESGDLIAAGANFDVVTQDLGIAPQDAVQIALTNLSNSAGLRGNLLLWSHVSFGNIATQDADSDELTSALQAATTNTVAVGSNQDFSHYDDAISDVSQNPNGFDGGDTVAGDVNGSNYSYAIEALPASVEKLPTLDASAIFWILKPAEFESYSQMIAARFGF